MNTVTVNKRGADRIRGGHLWIYRSDVVQPRESAGGRCRRARSEGNLLARRFSATVLKSLYDFSARQKNQSIANGGADEFSRPRQTR